MIVNCEWEALTKGSKCKNCENRLPRDYDEPPIAQCGNRKPTGLGNLVESLISHTGIKPCSGCKKRKELLNKVSEWWRGEAT